MTRLATTLVALGLAVSACGSTGADVRPFEDIQATEFVFEADPLDPNRSIFRVDTTEPAICAIVWGETEALGNFNNSLDMNGTGIIEHNVFLPGAVPGETYFFKVQGSTADGTLFESELATFSLPAVDAAPETEMVDRGPNLADGASVVEVSSEFSSSWGAANAIDGDMSTEWSTSGDGGDAFITIDLGSPQEIGGVEFITRSMADGSAITTSFTVTVDGGEALGPFVAGTPADPGFQELAATGQILRFDAEDTTGGNTGAVEIRVFAP